MQHMSWPATGSASDPSVSGHLPDGAPLSRLASGWEIRCVLQRKVQRRILGRVGPPLWVQCRQQRRGLACRGRGVDTIIDKIVCIRNVSRLQQCPQQGAVQLAQRTLIHGDNARGKTTLSAVLRSLAERNADWIMERQTIGADGDPRVVLIVGGKKVEFSGGEWTGELPAISVFDAAFITVNIHAGHAVEPGHRRNLLELILGDKAVALRGKIELLTEQIEVATRELGKAEAQVRERIAGVRSVDEFASLVPSGDVGERIEVKKREARTLEHGKEIIDGEMLHPLPLPDPPFDEVKAVLAKQLGDVATDAETIVRQHIEDCLDEKGEAWLSQGVTYLGEPPTKCPFCGQPLSQLALVKHYRDLFGEQYAAHKATINRLRDRVAEALSQRQVDRVQQTAQQNAKRVEFWTGHVDFGVTPDVQPDEPGMDQEATVVDLAVLTDLAHYAAEPWDRAREAMLNGLEGKALSPLEVVQAGPELTSADNACAKARLRIETYNASVESANRMIEALQGQVAAGNLQAVCRELTELEDEKARQALGVMSLCTAYVKRRDARVALQETKREKQDALDAYMDTEVAQYEGATNAYLKRFGASFTFARMRPDYRSGGNPRVTYRLRINDQNIDPAPRDPSKATPSFRTALSSGDISTLALAFFLARLDRMEDLQDHIVVFDDPLSSLDLHRRRRTVEAIGSVAERADQVVVLSHDPAFLRDVWDRLGRDQVETLRLARITDGNSDMRDWDIVEATRDQWFREYDALLRFAEGHDPDADLLTTVRRVRPVVEGHMLWRAPGCFSGRDNLDAMMRKVDEADPTSRLGQLKPLLPDLRGVNAYTAPYHHKANQDPPLKPPVEGELVDCVQTALRIIWRQDGGAD